MEILGRYYEVAGTQIYTETAGSGPRILCLHSAGRETRQWHGVMKRLSDRFCLTAVDLPGHGKSYPLPGHGMLSSVEEIAAWLSELAELAFAGDKYAVMGCSIGGNLSLLMGALYPNRVRAAIALQGADHTPALSEAGLEMLLHPMLNPMQGSVEFSRTLMGSRTTAEGADFMLWTAKVCDPISRYHDLGAYTRCDIREHMEKVLCPALLVHGEEDWIVPRTRVEATAGRLVNAAECSIVSIPGIGHAPHVEDPGALTAAIRGFLERHLLAAP